MTGAAVDSLGPEANAHGAAGTAIHATTTATTATEIDAAGGEQNVRVAVRVRPLVARERVGSSRECISEDEQSSSVSIGKRRFTFDHVFGKKSTQAEVFDVCATHLVDGCFNGYNATVLAYGQTGSGKTFTMGSGISLTATDEEVGIIPRAISRIYTQIEESENDVDVRIRCSFLEIYNEQVKDLLHPETPTSKIAIREHANGSIVVTGIREEPAPTAEAMSRLLMSGAHVRTTGSTLMNEQSSRSHAVFSITVEQKYKVLPGKGGEATEHAVKSTRKQSGRSAAQHQLQLQHQHMRKGTTAKFHLVDLAGSERNKKTGTVGARFKESVTINQGLLALGNVISALGDERKRCSHIPYRESKLTRMLQDSLGGNSRTVMIACVSSAESSIEETVNTLKYAHRARNIKNKPIINRDVEAVTEDAVTMEAMRQGVDALQKELAELENLPVWNPQQHISSSMHVTGGESTRVALSVLEQENSKLKTDMENFQVSSRALTDQVAALQSEKINMQYSVADFITRVGRIVDFCVDVEENMPNPTEELLYVVQMAKSCANAMPNIAELTSSPPTALGAKGGLHDVSSSSAALALRQHEQRIAALEKELAKKSGLLEQREAALAEVHEDLARDEVIFAEKVDELRRAESRADAAERELHALRFLFEKTNPNTDNNSQSHQYQGLFQSPASKRGSTTPSTAGRGAEAVGHNPLAVAVESDDEVIIEDDEDDDDGNLRDDSSVGDDNITVNAQQHAGEESKSRAGNHSSSSHELPTSVMPSETEEAIDVAETEARERSKAFERTRLDYEEQLETLSRNIKEKENMIDDLIRTEHEARSLSAALEQRARALEDEVKQKEAEVQSLLAEIDQLDSSVARTEDEKRKIRMTYEEKLRRVEAQLMGLKQQRKEQEESRVTKIERKSELRIAALTTEMDRMKQQQDVLKRKMSVAEERHSAAEADHNKRTTSLKKEAELSQKRIKELEVENERQRVLLKRKADEVAATQRKLKQLEAASTASSNTASAGGGSGNSRKDTSAGTGGTSTTTTNGIGSPLAIRGGRASTSPSPAKMTPTRGRNTFGRRSSAGTTSGHAGGLTTSSIATGMSGGGTDSGNTKHLRRIVHERVSNLQREADIIEELSRLRKKKDQLVVKRAVMLEERGVFDAKRQQKAKERSNEIMGLHVTLEDLAMVIEGRELQYATSEDATMDAEVTTMKQQRAVAQARKSELEEEQRAGIFLTVEDESALAELDDAIDALDTECEYLGSAVGDLERELVGVRANTAALARQSEGMTLHEAKALVGDLMNQLVMAKGANARAMDRVNTMELTVAEKEKNISDLGGHVRLLEMSTDKRVSDIQKVHDEQVGRMVEHMNAVVGRSFAMMHGSGGTTASSDSSGAPPIARSLASATASHATRSTDAGIAAYKRGSGGGGSRPKPTRPEKQRASSAREAAPKARNETVKELDRVNKSLLMELDQYRTSAPHLQSAATVRIPKNALSAPLSAEDVAKRRAQSARARTAATGRLSS